MRWLLLTACLIVLSVTAIGQGPQEFTIDPAATTVMVNVGRAGLFGFAGHDHEVAVPQVQGSVVLDPSDASRSRVVLQFDTPSMKVTGRGEPAGDVPEVQRVMLSDRVLDASRYPRISFASRRVVVLRQSVDRLTVRVEGDLTLREIAKPVSLQVDLQVSPTQISATGRTSVRQTDFGIQPVTAGAGTVRVKDEVEVVFTLTARRP